MTLSSHDHSDEVLLAGFAASDPAATAAFVERFQRRVYGLATAGFVWVLWSFTELELPFVQDEGVNPIVRLSGSLVVVSAALLPLLLDAAWRGTERVDSEEP